MRVRPFLALTLIALPMVAEAQERFPMPRVRDRGPARPTPLPPTATPIAREMVYVRLPFSVESYPMVSFFSAPALRSSWTSGGAGTRLDVKVAKPVSLTLDMTSSLFGGPMVTQTVELGARIRRPRSDAKWAPFLDLRAGYLSTYERQYRPYDFVDPSFATEYSRLNHGFGGIAGGGIEYDLHPRWTLTTSGSVFSARLAPLYGEERPASYRYRMTAFRYSVGLRFNPGRWSMPANLPQQIIR